MIVAQVLAVERQSLFIKGPTFLEKALAFQQTSDVIQGISQVAEPASRLARDGQVFVEALSRTLIVPFLRQEVAQIAQ
jgi:hypothetical protein